MCDNVFVLFHYRGGAFFNVPPPSLVAPLLDELGIQDILVYKQFHIYSTIKGGSVVDGKYFLLEFRKYVLDPSFEYMYMSVPSKCFPPPRCFSAEIWSFQGKDNILDHIDEKQLEKILIPDDMIQ